MSPRRHTSQFPANDVPPRVEMNVGAARCRGTLSTPYFVPKAEHAAALTVEADCEAMAIIYLSLSASAGLLLTRP
ncbi:hypothetical protein ASD99_00990 [Mesorhizobium sp. Root695]|nr:hypothetical protein ASD99_00990 [Mesorhizobium sp. Root695]